MTKQAGTLHFICGRLASGKTTLAGQIALSKTAVFICEDIWLSKLSGGIHNFEDYLKWSRRCRDVMKPLIIEILKTGTSVVLDFAGNTPDERGWVRSIFESAGAGHVLHYLEVSEEVCLARLKLRNETKPEGLYFATTSESEFKAISQYFKPPPTEERFNVVIMH